MDLLTKQFHLLACTGHGFAASKGSLSIPELCFVLKLKDRCVLEFGSECRECAKSKTKVRVLLRILSVAFKLGLWNCLCGHTKIESKGSLKPQKGRQQGLSELQWKAGATAIGHEPLYVWLAPLVSLIKKSRDQAIIKPFPKELRLSGR
jgi:hypothetical protein